MIFWCQGIFYMNFDFEKACKNEIKDNNEKSCSWSRNRVAQKIDFKAKWLGNRHAEGTSPVGEAHRLVNNFIFPLAPQSGAFKK